ncbi:hypothetical protein ACIRPX_37975 [Streptomyces sp. NPDC101225]
MPRKRKPRPRNRPKQDLRNAAVGGAVGGLVRAVIDWLRELI